MVIRQNAINITVHVILIFLSINPANHDARVYNYNNIWAGILLTCVNMTK